MKVILIGAGKLAYNLGLALRVAGHDILQVYSRTMLSAQQVANVLETSPTADINEIMADADVYIFAVKDSVLQDIIPLVCKGKEEKVFLHTAGSMPLDAFMGRAKHYGVFYPLQTFNKGRNIDFKNIPCLIEGNNGFTIEVLMKLAKSISNNVRLMASEERKYVHLAAIFACNFVNHCYVMAADILAQYNIPFDLLLPLIDETASKVHEIMPVEAQTGPALRYDENIIKSQSSMLAYNPFVKEIYDKMSIDIHRKAIEND